MTNSIQLGNHSLVHGDCIEAINDLLMESVDLVVADPPYFKVVGEKWDYQWRTEEEYLVWCRKWLELVYRSMRFGGSMYLFGYFRTLALMLPMLKDIGFSLRQQIVIDKGMKAVAGRATKNYKMFPCTTESVLLLTKDNIQFFQMFFDLTHQRKEEEIDTEMLKEEFEQLLEANGNLRYVKNLERLNLPDNSKLIVTQIARHLVLNHHESIPSESLVFLFDDRHEAFNEIHNLEEDSHILLKKHIVEYAGKDNGLVRFVSFCGSNSLSGPSPPQHGLKIFGR